MFFVQLEVSMVVRDVMVAVGVYSRKEARRRKGMMRGFRGAEGRQRREEGSICTSASRPDVGRETRGFRAHREGCRKCLEMEKLG